MPRGSINSITQARRYWNCLAKQLVLLKQIVSMLSRWPKRFPTSSERPKIESPNSSLRSACIGKDPNAQSSGYTQFTLRLRTVFSAKMIKMMVSAEYLNAQTGVAAFRVERAMI